MPTKRFKRGTAHVGGDAWAGVFVREHLSGGLHLFAGSEACIVCQRGLAASAGLWRANRAAVLKEWEFLGVPFPCLGQIAFDGAELPPLNPNWRWLFGCFYASIEAEIAEWEARKAMDKAGA